MSHASVSRFSDDYWVLGVCMSAPDGNSIVCAQFRYFLSLSLSLSPNFIRSNILIRAMAQMWMRLTCFGTILSFDKMNCGRRTCSDVVSMPKGRHRLRLALWVWCAQCARYMRGWLVQHVSTARVNIYPIWWTFFSIVIDVLCARTHPDCSFCVIIMIHRARAPLAKPHIH